MKVSYLDVRRELFPEEFMKDEQMLEISRKWAGYSPIRTACESAEGMFIAGMLVIKGLTIVGLTIWFFF